MSIAAVALANGLNANMVRKWVIDAERRAEQRPVSSPVEPSPASDKPTPSAAPSFLPLALHAPAVPVDDIRIELQRGATAVKVAWPASAAADCAAWLRELLR